MPDPPPAAITRGFRFSNFTVLRNFCQNYFPNRHFRRAPSWPKTTILHKRQRWVDFFQIFARYNDEGFSLFQFYGFTELLPKLFPESSLPMSHILAKKRQFCAGANGVWGVLSYFRPIQLQGLWLFQFYGLTDLFPRLFSESSLPMNRILAKNDNFPQAPTLGGFLPYFRPLKLRGLFAFPILRL